MFSFKNGNVKNDDMETYIALQTRYIITVQSIMEIWSTVCMDILPTLLGTNEHSKEIEAIVTMAKTITSKLGAE